jgi:hypothetical protein
MNLHKRVLAVNRGSLTFLYDIIKSGGNMVKECRRRWNPSDLYLYIWFCCFATVWQSGTVEEVCIWNGKTTWFVEISTWKAAVLSEQTFLTESARSADEEFDITLYTLSAHVSLRDKSGNSYPGESRVK